MPHLRLRITGSDDAARAITNLLTSIDGVEHVEQIDDLMPHMDDPDSSSAGLSDNTQGARTNELEVEVGNAATATRVREVVAELALQLDVLVEYEHDEG